MPRRARLLIPGFPLHIVQRGHNRNPCFHRDADYFAYLERLGEHALTTGCSIHAYVLMTNHVHILASFENIRRAPDLVRLLGQQYSVYLNRRLGRTGTTWEGRYWSCPVPTEQYLLNCQRYIELNPVRVRLAGCQELYRWSSYRGNVGLIRDDLLTPHELYLRLGLNEAERQLHYRRLSECDLDARTVAELRSALNNGSAVSAEIRRRGRPKKQ